MAPQSTRYMHWPHRRLWATGRVGVSVWVGVIALLAVGCQYDWDLAEDTTTPPSCIRYVFAGAAPGGADGLTWETAFPDPREAIAAAAAEATSRQGCEVWVSRGTYYMYRGQGTDTLRLTAHVGMYGGFAGDETVRDQRDPRSRESILDGRGGPDSPDHVYHVITGADHAVLDGFTITQGRADGSDDSQRSGAGMLNDDTSPTVRNCTFVHNEAALTGGGVANVGGTPSLVNCRFLNNAASSGGAMHNRFAAVNITSCVFDDNYAEQRGGALASSASATVRVQNSLFVNNRADQSGGAIFNVDDAFTTVTSCILWNNLVGDENSNIANSAELSVSYSVVQEGYAGEGNLDHNPKFVDASIGDFRLKANSPCIDAADGTFAPSKDLDGQARVDDPNTENTGIGDPSYADIGAYEYQPGPHDGDHDE